MTMNRATVSKPLRWLAMAWAAGAFLLTGCTPSQSSSAGQAPVAQTTPTEVEAAPVVNGKPMAYALFAGGCFWCIEADFEKLTGVVAVDSGYTAGKTPKPTYAQVSAGYTGHTEAVRVLYDPSQVSYSQLVDYFWRHIDPTVKDQQFCDVGSQYRSGIYWQNETERTIAEASRDALISSGRFTTIHTELAPASAFHLAEDYHQDYYKKNELRYNYYRLSCGRDARVKKLWG
jgi:peptide-methionine (S)-S-oxide reductase